MNKLDVEKETERIIDFIKHTCQSAGFTDAVIGLSGGIDSAVSFVLAVRALGAEHVYPLLLPYGALNIRGIIDVMEIIEKNKIPMSHITRIDIKPVVDQVVRIDPFMDRIRKGNIMARMRMIYLFDAAKKHKALVLGTENKSEHELGYFTRFGDDASDVEPILHLYKTEVYELAKYLQIPESIIAKLPSADLWPEQTDEGELGFSYQEADAVLRGYGEEAKTNEHGISIHSQSNITERVLRQVKNNKYKPLLPYKL